MFRNRRLDQRRPTAGNPQAAPSAITGDDLVRAHRLADQWERAVGNGPAQLEFGRAWTSAAGLPTNLNALIGAIGRDQTLLQRPWQWLADVSHEALVKGDTMLVARVALVAQMWVGQVDPIGGSIIFQGIAVGKLRSDVRAQIMTAALYALIVMPPDRDVMGNETGKVQVADALLLCAQELLSVEHVTDSDTVAIARRTVGEGETTGSPLGTRAASQGRLILASEEQLARIGQSAFGGHTPYPSAFRFRDHDMYAISAAQAAGYRQLDALSLEALQSQFFAWLTEDLTEAVVQAAPWGGFGERILPAFGAFQSRFFSEAAEISVHVSPWAVVGLFCLAANLATDDESRADSAFTQLTIAALDVLRRDGVAYTAAPPFAIRMWQSAHGYDGALPKGWASPLRKVPVVPVGQEPATVELAPGESRAMSRDLADRRTMFAFRRDDGKVVGIIEGIDDGDAAHKRWECGVEGDTYTEFLRQLGERVVTPQLWTHDDLVPYIPCRARSRAEMAAEVARMPAIDESRKQF